MIEEIKKEIEINTVIVDDYYDIETEVICKEVLFKILDKYKNEDIGNKEVTDALCMLLSCALKDTAFETQKEQFHIVYDYINELEKYKNAWEELKKISQNDDCGEKTAHDFLWFLEQTMQELEKKHEIGVE